MIVVQDCSDTNGEERRLEFKDVLSPPSCLQSSATTVLLNLDY